MRLFGPGRRTRVRVAGRDPPRSASLRPGACARLLPRRGAPGKDARFLPAPVETPLAFALPPDLRALLDTELVLARALLVGGCVRDRLLGQPAHDIDVEVYGVEYADLVRALSRHGSTDVVGRSFGVVKLRLAGGGEVDFGLPRRDTRTGPGHRGFEVTFDPTLDPATAASRRDLTINALAWDPRRGVVMDFFGGLADLRARVLRHTSDAFSEDPLRVLRVMEFAARFDFAVAAETVALSASIVPAHAELARERIWGEWSKWASRSRRPSAGLEFLAACGWLAHYPELAALRGTPQDPRWHPEGDVWRHTLHALDALADDEAWRAADEPSRTAWSLAVLLHDAGKPACTRRERRGGEEVIVSPGHDTAGVPLAQAFLDRIGAPAAIAERVAPLVSGHMAHLQSATERAVRRLAARLAPETISGLAVVIRADLAGRPPLPAGAPPALLEMLRVAGALALTGEAPRPIVRGRHLLELGWEPGPAMGAKLAEAFEAQLDGEFTDLAGALLWLAGHAGPPATRG